MRITKDLTYLIIEKLISPITEKMKENDLLLAKIVTDYIVSNCPQEVFDNK